MKVLVTGASGFVGRYAVPELLRRGHTVIALARDQDRARTFAWFDQVSFVAHDIHGTQELDWQKIGAPEAMLHLAWPGLPNYKGRFHFEVNLPADYRFIQSMVQQGVRQVAITGTCFEYGMQNGCLQPGLMARPANPYALAKDTLRRYLQYLQVDLPFVLQWARLFYMFGDGQNPNSILVQLDRAIDRGDKIFNMSGGEQLRDYLPVESVTAKLADLLEASEWDGIANICSGEPVSIRRLVENHLIKRNAEMRLNFGFYPYVDYEPMAFWGQPWQGVG